MELIKWQLIANPVNWIIIVLMLVFAGFLAHILFGINFNKQEG